MEPQRAVRSEVEHAVGDAAVQVGMGIERRAEALHERHRPARGTGWRLGTAPPQRGLDRT